MVHSVGQTIIAFSLPARINLRKRPHLQFGFSREIVSFRANAAMYPSGSAQPAMPSTIASVSWRSAACS
jgi:hypothetical protein